MTASSTTGTPTAGTPTTAHPTIASRVLSLPIRGWRVVSTRMPPRCRFHPSCSAYALEALERHGAARGTWLAVRRVGRCHPWNPGGFDPVPERPIRGTDESNVRSPHQRPDAA